ncbi:MAG: serine/threonine protein kinase [Mucilaginibacter sp.]|nr:serine/threonine protein kinase [Mucilaginibacter sp.]
MVKTSKRVTVSSDNRITLAKDGYDNIINIDGNDYEMRNLSDTVKGNRGGNSNVFKLVVADNDDEDYEDESSSELIIKISNIQTNQSHSYYTQNRKQRFLREIIALKRANQYRLPNVVKIINHGEIKVQEKVFLYYTMEKGTSDLTDYLDERRSIQQKILLFTSILKGIKQLHGINIYHRDIKHDNIFMFGEECKIGDLGLMRFKKEDELALDNYQRLGAFGWETPEAMNKFLAEKSKNPEFTFDCNIDGSSDIFQLGKLFWFILQGNLPIGCLDIEDFKIEDAELFTVLEALLQHGKNHGAVTSRRPLNINSVETLLQPIAKKYGVA